MTTIGTATVLSDRPVNHGFLVPIRKRRKDATKLTEREFQAQVVAFAKLHGWKVYHTRDSRGSEAGFPDLILVKGRRIFAWELKVKPNTVSLAQVEWIEALRYAGVAAQVLYPEQWDWIQATLAGCISGREG